MNGKVQAGEVLGEAEPAARFFSLDLARALGLPAKEAVRHLITAKTRLTEELRLHDAATKARGKAE